MKEISAHFIWLFSLFRWKRLLYSDAKQLNLVCIAAVHFAESKVQIANVWQMFKKANINRTAQTKECKSELKKEMFWSTWKFSQDCPFHIRFWMPNIHSMNSRLEAFRISQKNYVGYWLVLCRQKDRLCMWQSNKASICQLPNWNQQWIGYLQHCYFYRHDANILYSCIIDGMINSRSAVAQNILLLYYLIKWKNIKIETHLTGKMYLP